MFRIEFIDKDDGPILPIGRSNARKAVGLGEITIGSFKENFESPLEFWSRDRYKCQWFEAISAILSGSIKEALFTSVYDPVSANFFTWWPMYRQGNIVFIQNSILFLNSLSKPFEFKNAQDHIGPRRTLNEDGDKISEWSISLNELRDFHRLRL